jgi:hypothetical protein
MTKNTQLQIGSIIEYDKRQWVVYDWCTPCQLVWFEMLGEKNRARYSQVKLIEF